MKLYRFVWKHPSSTSSIVFWSHDKLGVKYWGHLHAERVYGLTKDQIAELPQGVVQEIDVPTTDAETLAKWLNAELEARLPVRPAD